MTRVVCALSGGGAKTAAHLGALRALDEHGMTPQHYVATSMGAVVAAALAAGVTYDEALRRLTRVRRRDVAVPSLKAVLGYLSDSLFRPEPLRRFIASLVPARRFDDLEIPLTVTAADLERGDLVLFGDGGLDVPLHDALYAACALPIYYPAARVAGRLCADGGLRAVLPLDVAAGFEPDLIYAVSVGPSRSELPAEGRATLPPLVRRHGEVLRVMMAAQTEELLARWADRPHPELVVVQPPVQAETTFAVDRVAGYVEEGYRTAMRVLGERRVPQRGVGR
ncbi:MAG: patatin-like phospholipase family protein [Gemmatimonadota bacterium]|nr:patatin-like phospholipase family protein [Gemmatimonadota bacterium]